MRKIKRYSRIKFFYMAAVFALLQFGLNAEIAKPITISPEIKSQKNNVINISLAEAFDIIKNFNYQILSNHENLNEEIEITKISRSEMLPKVEIKLEQSRRQFVTTGRGFTAISPTTLENRFDAMIRGIMPLFDKTKYSNWQLSIYDLEITNLVNENTLQDIYFQTANAYFTHIRNIERIGILNANIERDIYLLNLAKNQFEAGVANRIDVTRAESQLATDQKEKLQQFSIILESSLRLKMLLNIKSDQKIKLTQFRVTSPNKLKHKSNDLKKILESRSDYKSAQVFLRKNIFKYKSASSESLPKLEIYGEWGYASSEAFDSNKENAWATGISLTIPVYEGNRIVSNVRRVNSLIRSQEYTLKDIEQKIEAEVKLATQKINSRYQQIKITQKKVDLGNEELKLAKERFKQGVADNRDVIDAQTKVADSNDEYIESIYQYSLSRLSLARATGDVRTVLE